MVAATSIAASPLTEVRPHSSAPPCLRRLDISNEMGAEAQQADASAAPFCPSSRKLVMTRTSTPNRARVCCLRSSSFAANHVSEWVGAVVAVQLPHFPPKRHSSPCAPCGRKRGIFSGVRSRRSSRLRVAILSPRTAAASQRSAPGIECVCRLLPAYASARMRRPQSTSSRLTGPRSSWNSRTIALPSPASLASRVTQPNSPTRYSDSA